MKHFLKQTIYLLPIFLMGVSFLSIMFDLNFVVWGNIGGYSLVTDVLFVYIFYYGNYCKLAKILPFGLILSNIVNILGVYFPKYYGNWYEIVIFSVILTSLSVYELHRRIFK
jgi:hypothetical protein